MGLAPYMNIASALSGSNRKTAGLMIAGGLGAALLLSKTVGNTPLPPIEGTEFVSRYPAIHKALVYMQTYRSSNEWAFQNAVDTVDRLLAHYEGSIDSPYATAQDVSWLIHYLNAYEAWCKLMWDSNEPQIAAEIRERYISSFNAISNLIVKLTDRLRSRAAISYRVVDSKGSRIKRGAAAGDPDLPLHPEDRAAAAAQHPPRD